MMAQQSFSVYPVFCTNCRAGMGYVIERRNGFYLTENGLSALVGDRRCPVCGQVLHWHGDRCTLEDVQRLSARDLLPIDA